ncbi:hypothetical protein [Paenibacillus alvei]|uniref:hypothetical protein n=1 Tax=Paenibacillus alvei TaxID=44250 RepID=UPI0013DAF019|nr:hypothetical protein [Paenibacillus alvei]NEZ44413.1 hypothetical protein [Paenibacillus alvei]
MWRSCAAAVKWISRSMHVDIQERTAASVAQLCSCCGVSRPIDARRHPGCRRRRVWRSCAAAVKWISRSMHVDIQDADGDECGAAVQLP